jgi:DDE superfamily endonuclease
LNVLYSYFLSDRATTQQERADYLLNEIGLKVHRSTISRTFKRDKFANKRAAKHYLELDINISKQFIRDNYHLFSSPHCLAVDEFGVNLGETSRYAYARKGCRAIISRKGQKGFNHTFILCVRNIGNLPIVNYEIIKNERKKIKDEKTGKERIKKGTDTIDFYNFLKNINLPTNEKYYLLLDNSPIHDPPNKRPSKILKEADLLNIDELAVQKNIILVYLPAYAPMINPAELCINFIKGYVRGKRF